MNETETYFQYHVSLRPEDLQVGRNFITDKVESSKTNYEGNTVTWYQFRIPISEWESDFQKKIELKL